MATESDEKALNAEKYNVPQELPFLLSEQAKDRYREFEAEQTSDPAQGEGSLEPSPSQVHTERRRLRHAAQIAENAHRLAQSDEGP